MPKQVRLRRGTTAQHTTFTGADGEVTFDSTKKVLVVHDGVTAGGKPIEGFVKLDPGNTLAQQEIKGPLYISGGDGDHIALSVDNPTFVGELTASGFCEAKRLMIQQEALAYAGTINLDFNGFGGKRIALTGNVSFTSGAFGFGKQMIGTSKPQVSFTISPRSEPRRRLCPLPTPIIASTLRLPLPR